MKKLEIAYLEGITIVPNSIYKRPALIRAADMIISRTRPTILEFGTASGSSMRSLLEYTGFDHGKARIHAFDCFHGLPEDWRAGYPAGSFSTGGVIPADIVEKCTVHDGLFEDTLPRFVEDTLARGFPTIDLIHIDCDLYNSTRVIFKYLAPYINSDTVLVFDELVGYPGWEDHEYRALVEFLERNNLIVLEGSMYAGEEQVLLRVGKPRDSPYLRPQMVTDGDAE